MNLIKAKEEKKEWDADEEVEKLINKNYEIQNLYEKLGYPRDLCKAEKLIEELESIYKGLELIPKGTEQFDTLLYELKKVFLPAYGSWKKGSEKGILDCIENVHKELNEKSNNFPNSFRSLRELIESAFSHIEPKIRKQTLDSFLSDLVEKRHSYKWDSDNYWTFEQETEEQAKRYLDEPLIHTPWLTNAMIEDLLNSAIGPIEREKNSFSSQKVLLYMGLLGILDTWFKRGQFWWLASITAVLVCGFEFYKAKLRKKLWPLIVIRHEIYSKGYDTKETARRIRKMENKGLYVHSLVFPLLSLHKR